MKTVAATLQHLDENLRYSAEVESRELGRLHADSALRHVLGLPRDFPGDSEHAPAIVFEGATGRTLSIVRLRPGGDLHLTVTEGEEDLPLDDRQASYRVRLFVEEWGEETDLTEEIRLPPELRAEIAGRETRLDETRRERLEQGPTAQVFVRRARFGAAQVQALLGAALAACILFNQSTVVIVLAAIGGVMLVIALALLFFVRRQILTVDRDAGRVRERQEGKEVELVRLDVVRQADVRPSGPSTEVEVVLVEGGTITLGQGGWTEDQAVRIADAMNDAIGLPESRRKLLTYRRRSLGDLE